MMMITIYDEISAITKCVGGGGGLRCTAKGGRCITKADRCIAKGGRFIAVLFSVVVCTFWRVHFFRLVSTGRS